ncbi:tRNA (5-methylaminomethyl-2-thiouridine)(34)-methyltransferase MnmD [Thalassococcus lentus]|uniref:tRNA (5-methylaminomethyl-2-thiouridine)(34)-methyltransferase MnmD n=1 Tax=Thalassococcus lentus TaxID=1210524 RepID=A0ABT4XXA2_9RHOB|nr:tRNA (5-methylaminomethyl-2-thiouridine)(34)-methyltransferase MnmD [Thalassococcus lentus]MDA7426433.1 tRNA (5-methylaminomethyl-2-thiouridine)(34)-methyltransferase MnmD [Thalassococcus lentus]
MSDQSSPETHQPAKGLEWNGQVPVSQRFDDPYYSLENGHAETQHVFLSGNDLPNRFKPDFHIAELGFGTGLNLLAALSAWRASHQSGVLHFTSFEAFPLPPEDMITAQSAFEELSGIGQELAGFWRVGAREISLPDLRFTLVVGDARDTLPAWTGQADAWFLDGFSPAKNPELWGDDLMKAVYDHTAPTGTAATYTAAGHVRRALTDAGFDVERIKGFGRKRHMTTARKADT